MVSGEGHDGLSSDFPPAPRRLGGKCEEARRRNVQGPSSKNHRTSTG